MRAFLNYIGCYLDRVFPEREDHKLVRSIDPSTLFIRPQLTADDNITSLLRFRDPEIRALIHEAKFHQNERAFELLGELLGRYLKRFESENIVVPIPLSAKRRRQRGCNQVEEVVKRALRSAPHLKMDTGLIYRVRNTVPQTSLSRHERLENVRGAFATPGRLAPTPVRLILIDDVATTGATLKAAATALGEINAPITLLSLAR